MVQHLRCGKALAEDDYSVAHHKKGVHCACSVAASQSASGEGRAGERGTHAYLHYMRLRLPALLKFVHLSKTHNAA